MITDINWTIAAIYLTVVNILGFLSESADYSLNKNGNKLKLGILTSVLAFLGGSLGALTAMIILRHRPEKETMMSRVFIICIFVIQFLFFLFILFNKGEPVNFDVIGFFANTPLFIYLIIINCVTFVFFAFDKRNAEKNRPRIKIVTLLGLCFIGGSLGGLAGMYLLRHKTRKSYFTVGIPLIIITHLALVFFIINL